MKERKKERIALQCLFKFSNYSGFLLIRLPFIQVSFYSVSHCFCLHGPRINPVLALFLVQAAHVRLAASNPVQLSPAQLSTNEVSSKHQL